MYIVCDETSSYYSKIKNTINIPIVFCSAGLSIVNTYDTKDSHTNSSIRHLGVVLNILIALSLSILNIYKITEKEFFFSSQSVKFLKIYNKINIEIMKTKTESTKTSIMNIITEYNILCEHIHFHIPSHIRKSIVKNYKNFNLPFLLLNTIKKNKKWKLFTAWDENNTDTNSTNECFSKWSNETSYISCYDYKQNPKHVEIDNKQQEKEKYSTILKTASDKKNDDNPELQESEKTDTTDNSPISDVCINIYDKENVFLEEEIKQEREQDYNRKHYKKRRSYHKK
jgi:hypothetical protein